MLDGQHREDLSPELQGWLNLIAQSDSLAKLTSLDQLRFPDDSLLAEYISVVRDRPEPEVTGILRQFLFPPTTFGADRRNFEMQLQVAGGWPQAPYPMEYWSGLLRNAGGHHPAQPGLRWVLDLLPEWPEAALRVIEAYTLVFGQMLPDARLQGLADASTLIRSRYVEGDPQDAGAARATIANLRPRELEVLVAAAYKALGHETTLTPPTRDGGRDIEAQITRDGMVQRVLIECKHWSGTVGVETIRSLGGVVQDDRATSGVLITTSSFSPEARAFAERTAQLHLIDGDALIELLTRSLGASWFTQIDRLVARDRANQGMSTPETS